MSALVESLRGLGAGRLITMAAVGAALIGLLGFLALHAPSARMDLLYADLDMREAGQMMDQLEREHIVHDLAAGGTEIRVAADSVARARLLLAKQGLPSGGSIGYEIFDRGDGLTSSAFQQRVSEVRALEGELARSIRAINGVRAARVHLVLPRREPFARDRQDAQASVLLTMAGAGRLDREGISAILNLVSAAVPGLRPRNIAVVDSRGNLLAKAGELADGQGAAQTGEEIKHATGLRLSRAVEEMLEHSLGMGRVRAEASVDMDFAQIHETEEKYDPDGQVVRSTQTVSDNNKTTEASNTVSVQNNLPNADAGAPGAGNQQARAEETTNYEIGKTVRTLVREQPQIRRISLAVLVDGIETPVVNGPPTWKERPPEELERIGKLVRSAIGFDEKRGDKVEVVSMRFVTEAGGAPPEALGMLASMLANGDGMRLAQLGIVALIALLGILTVLRPMAMRLSAAVVPSAKAVAGPGAGAGALAGPDGSPALLAVSTGTDLVAVGGGGEAATVNLANVLGLMRASSIRRVSEFVEKHPEESLSIVRGWMQREPV